MHVEEESKLEEVILPEFYNQHNSMKSPDLEKPGVLEQLSLSHRSIHFSSQNSQQAKIFFKPHDLNQNHIEKRSENNAI
jgi:hypothetical protein